MESERIKSLERALRVVVALDARVARGEMDDAARDALEAAEALIGTSSGRLVLAAFRGWHASGTRAFDPTGGFARMAPVSGQYADMAMRGRR